MILVDMDMPKSCSKCRFNDSSCWCSITKSEIDREFECSSRLDDCPIKDVGEIKAEIEYYRDNYLSYESDYSKVDAINKCIEIIDRHIDKKREVSCDRNICVSNEYNGIGCDECVVNKENEEC